MATAIFLGGPGALFWMWITAIVGMATKYAEAVLAVRFREVDELGNHVGGPMYYIKNGLGKKWSWLAVAFAVFGAIAGFGIGNTVQSNSVASVMTENFGISPIVTGIILFVLTGADSGRERRHQRIHAGHNCWVLEEGERLLPRSTKMMARHRCPYARYFASPTWIRPAS